MAVNWSSRTVRWVLLAILAIALGGGFAWGTVLWNNHRTSEFGRRCRESRDQANWDDLAEVSEQWTQWQPESGDAWVLRAVAADESGDLIATADFLERVPDDYHGAVPAFLELSALYFDPLRRPIDGVRTCERILSVNPEIVVAHQRLCHYFAMTLQRDRLLKQVRESIRLRAETVDAYSYFVTLPDLVFSDALPSVKGWLEVTPDEPTLVIASALIRARDESLKSGNEYAAAMTTELKTLHERFPENLEVLTTLLEIISHDGDVEQVEKLLEQAPANASEDYRMWRFRSWHDSVTGNVDGAEKAARESIRMNPMDWHGWQHLSGILRRQHQPEKAAEAQATAMFGKDLQAVILALDDMNRPPRSVIDGILEYAETCGDTFVAENLSRRLKVPRTRRTQ